MEAVMVQQHELFCVLRKTRHTLLAWMDRALAYPDLFEIPQLLVLHIRCVDLVFRGLDCGVHAHIV